MKPHGFANVALFIALLHLAVFSIVFGGFKFLYLLCAVLSGVVIWIFLPWALPLRRTPFLLTATFLSIVVQLLTYRIWRDDFENAGWPLAQYLSIHGMIYIGFAYYTSRRSSTYVWRGTMLKK